MAGITHQKGMQLEDEVAELEEELRDQQRTSALLRRTLHGSPVTSASISPLLSLQVRALVTELAIVEEEILFLEQNVKQLKFSLYREKKQVQDRKQRYRHSPSPPREHRHTKCGSRSREDGELLEDSTLPKTRYKSQRIVIKGGVSIRSVSELKSRSHLENNDVKVERSRFLRQEINIENPNKVSEELLSCLIRIFHKLHVISSGTDTGSSSVASKLSLSCMSSESPLSKSSFNCKIHMNSSDGQIPVIDVCSTVPDTAETARAQGPYKKYTHFVEKSLRSCFLSECTSDITRLGELLSILASLDISALTHKQKLAFWINLYNSCIMQAYLQMAPMQDNMLVLLNKAVVNVGGIVMNSLAIEHFILRNHCDMDTGCINKKEALVRYNHGLRCPEPNITFALCRGTRSSPALRVYTEESVTNELGSAKTEYLEASVRIMRKNKVVIPKLLHWHMTDFADRMESLLEWIYSKLRRTGKLKRSMMDCLSRDVKLDAKETVMIQPYESEFLYLLPP